MNTEFPISSSSTAVTITANARLARELRRSYDRRQVAAGLSTWIAPEILPFGSWLERCWREWLYSGAAGKPLQLLRPSQELAIWEDIICRSDEGKELLQIAATAEAALDAWNLMWAWQLPLNASEWNDSSDTEAFRRWAREFQRRCESNGWLSGAMLPEFIASQLAAGAIAPPEHILLAGFSEFTPSQQLVLDALRRTACRVEIRSEPGGIQNAVRIGFQDTDAEIRAAAQWARSLLEKTANGPDRERPIGIVVPDLSKYRSRIERIFAGEFHPNGQLSPDQVLRRAFNISLGASLFDYTLF